jgi:hypothetical protein
MGPSGVDQVPGTEAGDARVRQAARRRPRRQRGAHAPPGGETVRHLARATANRLSTSADYVRSHNAKRMVADVETFVKGNPGPALVVAAAFGFLFARALSRD